MFNQKEFTKDFADLIKKYDMKMVDESSFVYTNDEEAISCGVDYLLKGKRQTVHMDEICEDVMELLLDK